MRLILILFLLLAGPASAACGGRNLLDSLPAADRARLEAAAAAQPFHSGNFWTARKEGRQITLAGTYHLADPRQAAQMQALTPLIAAAKTVLVEAGPEEEAALKARAGRDPSILVLTGTSLPDQMDEAVWLDLAEAMERRGIPRFMAAKLQPWYLSVMLAIPPCMMPDMASAEGLDKQVMRVAAQQGVPVRALEPYDTVFHLFGKMPLAEQIAMLRASLAVEPQAEDYMVTLSDSYFAGQSRLVWELMREAAYDLPGFTRAQIDADFARMEQAMMTDRNRAWIPVIDAAAAEGPVLVAFGALHLPGETGVLALLEQEGYRVTPLPAP